MRAQDIIGRGVQLTKYADKTFSHTGQPDFKEQRPEILKMEPKSGQARPRSKQSVNNSYT